MWKFGHYLRSIREQKGLSLAKLGQRVGHTRASISAIELGRRQLQRSPQLVGELERALGLDPGELAQHLPNDHPARKMIMWARQIDRSI